MYKKILNADADLLFTHQQQRELQKPNPVILDNIARTEMYLTNTFAQIQQEGIYGLLLSTRSVLLEACPIMAGKNCLTELTLQHLLGSIIEASATRIILVHHQPMKTMPISKEHQHRAAQIKNQLLDYSLLLDDFFLITKTDNSHYPINTTSLARLGWV